MAKIEHAKPQEPGKPQVAPGKMFPDSKPSRVLAPEPTKIKPLKK